VSLIKYDPKLIKEEAMPAVFEMVIAFITVVEFTVIGPEYNGEEAEGSLPFIV
jgi:hypothetical protein